MCINQSIISKRTFHTLESYIYMKQKTKEDATFSKENFILASIDA